MTDLPPHCTDCGATIERGYCGCTPTVLDECWCLVCAPPVAPASESKQSNPKDAVGTRKVPFSTVPAPFVAELGLAMLEGARKYARHNFRVIGVRGSVYYDAALRHLTAWWEGEDLDPDSGLSHLTKAAACMAVLRDSQRQGNWTDDRPPPTPAGWTKELNEKAAEIIDRIPNAKEPYVK